MHKKNYSYIFWPVFAIIIMWLSKLAEYFLVLDFKTLGIYPRKLGGLKGIILSPFIHNDFNHLISNTLPFLLLSMAIFFFYKKPAFRIIFSVWMLTGIAVWLGGRYAWHIGASGLVYAFASFLFFSGILSKERRLIAISLLVIFLYGGMIWGVLPGKINISWESHLFGFISGFIVAFYIGKNLDSVQNTLHEKENTEFSETNSTHEKAYNLTYLYKEEDA
jgi:membrane associated rhomboid family serine protease